MVLHFLCFYGHPTLSSWFTSEYKKSGKKLDMGKGCVRFKKLEDLALDTRAWASGRGCLTRSLEVRERLGGREARIISRAASNIRTP